MAEQSKPETKPKVRTRADDIRDCENSIRSLESRRKNLAGRFQGEELAKRLRPVEEKMRQRQAKLEELKKGGGDKE
jgi:hypothetical protein